jgi:hypothetical protein
MANCLSDVDLERACLPPARHGRVSGIGACDWKNEGDDYFPSAYAASPVVEKKTDGVEEGCPSNPSAY